MIPDSWTTVVVTQTALDWDAEVRGDDLQGVDKAVRFTPRVPYLQDLASRQIHYTGPVSVSPDRHTGYLAQAFPATDDTQVHRVGWTLLVEELWHGGRVFDIALPKDTPVFNDPGDPANGVPPGPLHGKRVIDLSTVVESVSSSTGYVQLVPGPPGPAELHAETHAPGGGDDLSTWYVPVASRGQANGVATLDAGGLLPTAQLPPLSMTDTFVVNSQAAMLALNAQRGDVAVRSDLSRTFILAGAPASALASWVELPAPAAAVLSVNAKTGVVVLSAADVGAVATTTRGAANGVATLNSSAKVPSSQLALTESDVPALPVSKTTGLQAALDGKASAATPVFSAIQTVAQAIPNGGSTDTPITFTTEEIDSHNGHSTTTNTSRYTATVAGWYRVSGVVCTDGAGSYRITNIRKNGVDVPGASGFAPGAFGGNRVPVPARLVYLNGSTDYVEIAAYAQEACSTVTTSLVASMMLVEFVRS